MPELCTMTGELVALCCIVETKFQYICTGLSVEMRENFNLMKDMGQHTRVAPQDRCKHLQELMNKIKHNDEVKQELDGFGLDFEGSLMTFKGRALPPEKILTFDRSSTYRMGEPDWTRSLRDAKLLSSPAIDVRCDVVIILVVPYLVLCRTGCCCLHVEMHRRHKILPRHCNVLLPQWPYE